MISAIGLDIGKKRIGVAGCDGLGLIATGLTTIEHRSFNQTVEQLRQIVQDRRAEILVVGLPYRMDGELNQHALQTQKFAHRLAAALQLLAKVGLADRAATYPDKLSGGQQQRVAIARALAHDPQLVLADEPTGNLDEETGQTVLELLLNLTRSAGKTLVMATHNPDIARHADRVLRVQEGQIAPIATTPEEMAA